MHYQANAHEVQKSLSTIVDKQIPETHLRPLAQISEAEQWGQLAPKKYQNLNGVTMSPMGYKEIPEHQLRPLAQIPESERQAVWVYNEYPGINRLWPFIHCQAKTRLKPASIIRQLAKKKSPRPTYPAVKTGNGREKVASDTVTSATDTAKKPASIIGVYGAKMD